MIQTEKIKRMVEIAKAWGIVPRLNTEVVELYNLVLEVFGEPQPKFKVGDIVVSISERCVGEVTSCDSENLKLSRDDYVRDPQYFRHANPEEIAAYEAAEAARKRKEKLPPIPDDWRLAEHDEMPHPEAKVHIPYSDNHWIPRYHAEPYEVDMEYIVPATYTREIALAHKQMPKEYTPHFGNGMPVSRDTKVVVWYYGAGTNQFDVPAKHWQSGFQGDWWKWECEDHRYDIIGYKIISQPQPSRMEGVLSIEAEQQLSAVLSSESKLAIEPKKIPESKDGGKVVFEIEREGVYRRRNGEIVEVRRKITTNSLPSSHPWKTPGVNCRTDGYLCNPNEKTNLDIVEYLAPLPSKGLQLLNVKVGDALPKDGRIYCWMNDGEGWCEWIAKRAATSGFIYAHKPASEPKPVGKVVCTIPAQIDVIAPTFKKGIKQMDIEKLNCLTKRANELSQAIEIIKQRPILKINKFEIQYESERGFFVNSIAQIGGLPERIYTAIENELMLHLASHAGEIAELWRGVATQNESEVTNDATRTV